MQLIETLEHLDWQVPCHDPAREVWDVIIVGAGPAGAIAARHLASAGHRVLMIDRDRFPRDKTCGDALIPDSLRALERAGLLADVDSAGCRLGQSTVFSPSRIEVGVHGEFVTLKRRILDAIVAQRAVGSGAVLMQGLVVHMDTGPDGLVEVRVQGHRKPYLGRFGVLATGARVSLLQQAGMLERPEHSAVALRCYMNSTARLDQLIVSYDRSIAPGYGWIFPLGNNEFNVGCGLFYHKQGLTRINLKQMFWRFLNEFSIGRQLLRGMKTMTPLVGAPLRCSLSGAQVLRGNLVAIGETIGATFPFTGEGIGKAMETAELAAKAISAALTSGELSELLRLPSRLIETLLPRYRGYEAAQRWLSRPWLSDLIAWRAQRSAAFRKLLTGILTESVSPDRIFSFGGVLRSLWS